MRGAVLALLALTSCGRPSPEAQLDPEACVSCHPAHVQSWRGSMHAHAADDPLFVAMNAAAVQSGQVEPDFCVSCHAPVALRLGETTDGTDLDEVDPSLRGVTCAFCHQLDGVEGDANGEVSWAHDGVMRGGIADPMRSVQHRSAYSPLLDRNATESSDACGACHDVRLPDGLHLERTYAEWDATIFATDGAARQSCAHCHLPGRPGVVAPGGPERVVHDHAMPGVDVALVDWPERDAQRAAIQDLLDRTLTAELCVSPAAGATEISLTLENVAAGHDVPSGASHDRRMWVEVRGRRGGEVVYDSGVIADGERLDALVDPDLVALHDVATTRDGSVSHSIFDAVDLEERALVGAPDPLVPHARTTRWNVAGAVLDQVDVRVRLRPVGLDVLDHHIDAGRLDADLRAEMPTFDLGSTVLSWSGPAGCVR